MYHLNPLLRPDGPVGEFGRASILDAVPLCMTVAVASSSRAPPSRARKSKATKKKTCNSLPVTVLETDSITNTFCQLLDTDFDEALSLCRGGKLLEECRLKPPHVYTVCTEQNLGKVGILISLERQFELAEAVRGAHPKHGLKGTAPGPIAEESEETDEDEEIEADEESGQPSCSEDEETCNGSNSREKSRCKPRTEAERWRRVADCHPGIPRGPLRPSLARRWFRPGTKGKGRSCWPRRRKSCTSSTCFWRIVPKPNARPCKKETVDGFHKAMQKTVQGFHKEVTAKLGLISDRRSRAEFSLGVNFLASVETELSRLRKLANAEHEQLTTSMAELEDRLRQSEGQRAEMDIELAEAVSLQRSAEAERDRAVADFLQSQPSRKLARTRSVIVASSEIHRGDECLDLEVEVPSARIETVDHLEESFVSTPRFHEESSGLKVEFASVGVLA
ncbi:unnamed protein product [Cuscuta campestris]|uniref:Uncharacterized protein n=1 Tax=Cuscuta campestris TaxID=132261 RepID=A0A484KAQ7_9ASTE|nr:unnamed protein product [Cuscuta campestris]